MSKYLGTISTHFGPLDLTEFVGPAVIGEDRRCLQIWDQVQLTRSDARQLLAFLEKWLQDERNDLNS